MNVLLVSNATQLAVGTVTRQVQKGVFIEKGFVQSVPGQHQLCKPVGGCDALPLFFSAAELLVVLLCHLASATAAPLGAVCGRAALCERPELRLCSAMLLVGLVAAAGARIIGFHRVVLENAALSILQACSQRHLYQSNVWLINIGHKYHLFWHQHSLILLPDYIFTYLYFAAAGAIV